MLDRRYIVVMAADSLAALRKTIRAHAFERVYYLFGDEEYQKAEALRDLINAASDPATRDFNVDVRRAGELNAETVESLLGTPPLMAERRVVVIRDVSALKKSARAALERYLNHPSGHVLLVLVDAGGEKAVPDKNLQRLARSLKFEPLKSGRISPWIVEHVQSFGASITPEAIDLLESAIGPDLPALAVEIEKLLSYSNGEEIDEIAVSAVVGIQRGRTLGDFLDHVSQRDAARALGLLPHILEQPKTTGVSIVMALTTQTLALAWGLDTSNRYASVDYYDLIRSTGAFTGRPWKEAVTGWEKAAGKWRDDELDGAACALLQADIALKDSRVSTDEQIVTSLTLALCAGTSVVDHHA